MAISDRVEVRECAAPIKTHRCFNRNLEDHGGEVRRIGPRELDGPARRGMRRINVVRGDVQEKVFQHGPTHYSNGRENSRTTTVAVCLDPLRHPRPRLNVSNSEML